MTTILDWLAAEEVDELDDQDYYDHQLQDEGAGLVELLDHEAVEIFGGLQLFFDQVFVVGHSDFRGGEFVEAGGKHVAEELDGVVGALGEFVDVEQHGVQFRSGAGGAPARPEAGASRVEEVVDIFELAGEEFVVVAELEQLRVGVLQELDGGFGAGGRVVDEGGVPSDDGEVVGIVRNARLQHFLSFAFGELRGFSADDLGDLIALGCEQVSGGGRSFYFAQVEDEVVLLQPGVALGFAGPAVAFVAVAFLAFGGVGLDESRGGALEF